MTVSEANGDELPDWMPDEYDPNAPLSDRLPITTEIEGGIELWAGDDRGLTKILGEPHEIRENGAGTLRMHVGGSEFNWNYEVVVPASDTDPFVQAVNPDQDVEDYERTKTTELEGVDVRIYGIDHDRLEGVDESEPEVAA